MDTSLQNSLHFLFAEINQDHFDSFLETPTLSWNTRLRSSAGRFIPGRRLWGIREISRIEIASYLLEEEKARLLVSDTMAHEMIHYWLWLRKRPYGHSPEFHRKMREMGVSRYNPVPRLRPNKYLYLCPACQKEFPAKKKWNALACSDCCKKHSHGQYDQRFGLILK